VTWPYVLECRDLLTVKRRPHWFLAASNDSGATVRIADILRPPQRVYLMYWSFAISHEKQNPAKVPLMDGVDIQWVHIDSDGNPDPTASVLAAAQMVAGYGIVFKPITKQLAICVTYLAVHIRAASQGVSLS
jgi:hypothetical protein